MKLAVALFLFQRASIRNLLCARAKRSAGAGFHVRVLEYPQSVQFAKLGELYLLGSFARS